MTKKYGIIIITLIYLGGSCNLPESNNKINILNTNKIRIDSSNIPDTIDISSIIDTINIIKIKEKKESIIGGIEKLFVTNDKYIIFDPHYSNKINIYNKKGEFIKTLVNLGAGPKELTKLTDAWLNEDDGIEVYDNYLNKIQVFNPKLEPTESIFLDEIKLIGSTVKIIADDAKYLTYSGYNGYNFNNIYYKISALDENFKIKKAFFPYKSHLNKALIATPIDPFFKINDTIGFSQNYDNFIYYLDRKMNLKVRHELIYTKNPFPKEFEESIIEPNLKYFQGEEINFEERNRLLSNYSGYSGPWLETKKYSIFISFDENRKKFLSVYDKSVNELKFTSYNFKETKNYKMIIPPDLYSTEYNKNSFFGFYEGHIAILLCDKSSPYYQEINKDLDSFYIIEVKLK